MGGALGEVGEGPQFGALRPKTALAIAPPWFHYPPERPHLLMRHGVRRAALQPVPIAGLRQPGGEGRGAVHLVLWRELAAVKLAKQLLRLEVGKRELRAHGLPVERA